MAGGSRLARGLVVAALAAAAPLAAAGPGWAAAGDASATASAVEIANTPPVCGNVSIGNLFRGASASTPPNPCSDPDGDTITYSIDSAFGTVSIDADTGAVSYTASDPDYSGDDSVTMSADDGTDITTELVEINIINRHPSITSLTMSPPSPAPGQPVTLTATATDPDGDSLAYRWDLNNDGDYDDAIGQSVEAEFAAGPQTVKVLVSDNKAADDSDTKSISFTVGGGGNPGGPGGPGGNPGGGDTTAPTGTASVPKGQKLLTVLRKGLKFTLTLDEETMLQLELKIGKKVAKTLKLPVVVSKIVYAGQTGGTYRLKVSRKAARKLKRLRKVKLQLVITARDDAGNAFTKTLGVVLKR